MRAKKLIAIVVLACLSVSCWKRNNETVLGYAPVYGDASALKSITLLPAQDVEEGGKIYVAGNMLFQVESGKGIHITDISNPAQPQQKGFIKISGCQEVTVKNGIIYTNNMNDLVILQQNGNAIDVVKRLPESFMNSSSTTVPPEHGKFECPDPSKGVIVGWQKKTLINPNCSY
jgi:hypothetical protein